jgi:hypothetical protein
MAQVLEFICTYSEMKSRAANADELSAANNIEIRTNIDLIFWAL